MEWEDRFKAYFETRLYSVPHMKNFIKELLDEKDEEINRLKEDLEYYVQQEAGESY